MALYDEKKIPNIFRYGILLAAAYQAFLVLPMFLDSNSQGTRMQNATFTFIIIFMISASINIGEFLLFRFNNRSVKIIILGTEFIRGLLFWIRLPDMNIEMGGSNALNPILSLVTVLSLGIAVGGTASLLFNEKINKVASTPRMRAAMNLLPAIVILLIFMGTGFLESIGFGATRQADPSNLPPYTGGSIDYTAFNQPTWDSAYFLENLLDQFTAGLSLPDEPVFNVTNILGEATEPPTYWRLRAYDKYLYKSTHTTSDWDITGGSTIDMGIGPTYSQPVTGTKDARYQVDILVNRSNDIYENYIPTTWNGEFGAYVDKNTFSTSALGFPTTVFETTPYGITDSSGVKVQINYGSTVEDEEVVVSYICDYVQPDIVTIGASSLGRDQYLNVLNSINPAEADEIWTSIQNLYMQIPDETQTPGGLSYAAWAPNVVGNATKYNSPTLSVMQQAMADSQQLSPNAELGLTFSEEMWLSNAYNTEMDHPAPGQDFNEWFIKRGDEGGVSVHFASLLTTWLRLQQIPARLVEGYASGNDTLGDYTKRVITNRWKHVWTEALVPYLYNEGAEVKQGLQWVPIDPIGAALFGDSLPSDVGSTEETLYIFNPNTFDVSDIPNTFASSVHRIGTKRSDDNPYSQEVQELYSNNFNTSIPEGIVDVSTLVSSCEINEATGLPSTLLTPLAGVKVRFSLWGSNASGVTEIPLNRIDSRINKTTDSSGIASFQFDYTIIPHGSGQYRFKAEVCNDTHIFRIAWSDSNPIPVEPTSINDYTPISFIIGNPPPPSPVIPKFKEHEDTANVIIFDTFEKKDYIELFTDINFNHNKKIGLLKKASIIYSNPMEIILVIISRTFN